MWEKLLILNLQPKFYYSYSFITHYFTPCEGAKFFFLNKNKTVLKLYLHLTFCVQVPLNQASSQLLPQTQVHNESPSSPSYLHVSPTLVQRKTHEWDSGVQQLS